MKSRFKIQRQIEEDAVDQCAVRHGSKVCRARRRGGKKRGPDERTSGYQRLYSPKASSPATPRNKGASVAAVFQAYITPPRPCWIWKQRTNRHVPQVSGSRILVRDAVNKTIPDQSNS